MKAYYFTFDTQYLFKISFISYLLFFGALKAQRSITVAGGNWAATIPPITEAGSNYSGSYESADNQVSLTASVPLALSNGKVSVRYESNPTWNSNLTLSVRRTGDGTTVCVLCTITGGTAYQTVTLTDLELFRITAVLALGSYSNIPIKIRLTGVSVTIPAATYNSKLIFTIGAP
ncbi:hypothetical protein [Chryseobacterium indoltheticum]|uniref:hypothetical protein n=1 Tax=Chryseobacterium indoltheticum TaxID=254 RepID=UPI003F49585A